MIDAKEYATRILSVLNEFESDNIPAIVNTVTRREDAEEAISPIRAAVEQLLQSGEATLRTMKGGLVSISDIPEELTAIFQAMSYDNKSHRWRSNAIGATVLLAISGSGKKAADAALRARGDRWWTVT